MQWRIGGASQGQGDAGRRAGTALAAALGSVMMLACAAASAAPVGEHPPLSPTRDAVVTYRFQARLLQGKDATVPEHQVTVSFAASGDRLRIDPDDGQSATILDRPDQIMTLISMKERRYVQLRPLHGLHNPFFLGLGMTYHPGGTQQIAGVSCRDWAIDSPHGKATACVTEDGVILAEDGVDADGLTGHLQAVSVRYEDIPADRFQPPADFEKFNPLAKLKQPAQPAQAQPVPGAALDGSARGGAEASVPDQPHSPDDSVGDGSVAHGDQPDSTER